MWKIVLISLMACSDPVLMETPYIFETQAACEQGLKTFAPQLQALISPGSRLECRYENSK